MQYLVLRGFRSFDKYLEKGTVVDEADIRSPRLRLSEGKIVPAVSSLDVPAEFGTEEPPLQETFDGVDIDAPPKLTLSFKQ